MNLAFVEVLQDRYFECCYTIGTNWGFNIHDTLEDIQSSADLIEVLMQVVRSVRRVIPL